MKSLSTKHFCPQTSLIDLEIFSIEMVLMWWLVATVLRAADILGDIRKSSYQLALASSRELTKAIRGIASNGAAADIRTSAEKLFGNT